MSAAPSNRDLEVEFSPGPKHLSHEVLIAVRAHSKQMFGNQDRLEVAYAITRVELGRVNATDLHRDIDLAVNRIRSQLLLLVSMHLLAETGGGEGGKRMFEVQDREDVFWKFVVHEFEQIVRSADRSSRAPVPDRPKPEPQRHR